ncbi:MarR family winged helix-turn-helix transcriptional regulator [Novacetimonas sp. GS1]|uniref:MarR family winged helix-turn-helix transcriptional regulator n=1 Tax=Novacetimonas sp. GS1 TaxID=3119990 RepID=UPI002FCCEB52
MPEVPADPKGQALTDLILTVFRTNNLLLLWGDRLVSSFGLTSARWQILGAIVHAERPQPVAWLARDLGANRQNVQRIVNDLHHEGLVVFAPNPHHRRAHFVVLTEKGREIYDAVIEVYTPRVNALAEEMNIDDIQVACNLMKILKCHIECDLDIIKL